MPYPREQEQRLPSATVRTPRCQRKHREAGGPPLIESSNRAEPLSRPRHWHQLDPVTPALNDRVSEPILQQLDMIRDDDLH